MMVWLQRIVVGNSSQQYFKEKLCKIVTGDKKNLWNSKWLNGKLKEIVNDTDIVNRKIIEKLDKHIPIDSVREIGYDASVDFSSPIIVKQKDPEELVELKKLVKEYFDRTKTKTKTKTKRKNKHRTLDIREDSLWSSSRYH